MSKEECDFVIDQTAEEIAKKIESLEKKLSNMNQRFDARLNLISETLLGVLKREK